MVTLKFTAEKASKQLVIIPTVVVDYSDKAKKGHNRTVFRLAERNAWRSIYKLDPQSQE